MSTNDGDNNASQQWQAQLQKVREEARRRYQGEGAVEVPREIEEAPPLTPEEQLAIVREKARRRYAETREVADSRREPDAAAENASAEEAPATTVAVAGPERPIPVMTDRCATSKQAARETHDISPQPSTSHAYWRIPIEEYVAGLSIDQGVVPRRTVGPYYREPVANNYARNLLPPTNIARRAMSRSVNTKRRLALGTVEPMPVNLARQAAARTHRDDKIATQVIEHRRSAARRGCLNCRSLEHSRKR